MSRPIAELDLDFHRELLAHRNSTDDFQMAMGEYLRTHWTLEEIDDYAQINDITTRYERTAFDNWLRAYWEQWRRFVADLKSRADFVRFRDVMALTPAAALGRLPKDVQHTQQYACLFGEFDKLRKGR